MTTAAEPVRLAGSALSRSRHVCAFFHSKGEYYDVLMPFIKEGLEKGDRAFHLVNPKLQLLDPRGWFVNILDDPEPVHELL